MIFFSSNFFLINPVAWLGAYIKGIFIQDIYTNSTNGYTVGLLRVKESDILEEVNKVVTFTGTFDELKYKRRCFSSRDSFDFKKKTYKQKSSSYKIEKYTPKN